MFPIKVRKLVESNTVSMLTFTRFVQIFQTQPPMSEIAIFRSFGSTHFQDARFLPGALVFEDVSFSLLVLALRGNLL